MSLKEEINIVETDNSGLKVSYKNGVITNLVTLPLDIIHILINKLELALVMVQANKYFNSIITQQLENTYKLSPTSINGCGGFTLCCLNEQFSWLIVGDNFNIIYNNYAITYLPNTKDILNSTVILTNLTSDQKIYLF